MKKSKIVVDEAKFEAMGAADWAANHGCFAPLSVLLDADTIDHGLAQAAAWFRGWHRANIMAPIPEWTDEQNAARLEYLNA